jgi:hypothetical protein
MDGYINWEALASQTVAALAQGVKRDPFVAWWGQDRVSRAEQAIAIGNYQAARCELLVINRGKATVDVVRNALNAIGCHFTSASPVAPTGPAWSCFTARQFCATGLTIEQPASHTTCAIRGKPSMHQRAIAFCTELMPPIQEMDCQEPTSYDVTMHVDDL